MSSEQEIRNRVFQQATGSAPNFRAIDGVGAKTAEKVKGTIIEGEGRVQAPTDVQDLTDEQLADKAGISQNRARKVIKGAGGNPDREPRSTTGSVSAAGIKVPTGEFKTEISDKDKAEAKVSTSLNRGIGRSQEAARADKAKRAPVTTDYERWKDNKGELDYPGADTPTDDPKVLPKDLRQEQRPATTDPPERPEPRQDNTGSAIGALTNAVGISQGEDRSSMVADGLGGPRYNSDTGGYAETDRPEQEMKPPDIARGEDPFDMSSDGGVLDGSPTSRESDAEPGRLVEYGGEQLDLTQQSTDDLQEIDSFLSRNIDAEVEAQRAKGGTEPSSFAQNLARRQGKVAAELNRRKR